MTTPPIRPRAEKAEGLVLVAILLLVAGFAGAASFTHVKAWTLANSPTGTPVWFGWANAVISELVPIAALLTIRRRRRTGGPVGYPLALLIAAAGLSLAAQLAVAKPGLSGWLLSAVPALAFMALVKLVLAPTHTSDTEQDISELVATTPATSDIPTSSAAAVGKSPATATPEAPAHLLPTARFSIVQHEQTTGRPITADELAARMSITPATAGQLLAVIKPGHNISAPVPARVNGHIPALGGAR
jgi:hypothetical protein